jgi:hypothetical protein
VYTANVDEKPTSARISTLVGSGDFTVVIV